jgi:hypothetical protein
MKNQCNIISTYSFMQAYYYLIAQVLLRNLKIAPMGRNK